MPQETTTQNITSPIADWITSIVVGHPVLWFFTALILVIFIILYFIGQTFPGVQIVKSKIFIPLARWSKHRGLTKMAIKSDIKGHVNKEMKELGKHLPSGWIKEMDLDWVQQEDPMGFISDDRIVLRIRPVEDQNRNFVNTTYHFLKQVMFPKTNNVVPDNHLEGTVIYLCRKIVNRRNKETITVFEDYILEPAIQKHKKLLTYMADYETIDKRGFFTGTFLRELHSVANEVRFAPGRESVGREASEIIKHIKEFIAKYESEDRVIPDSLWIKIGNVAKYGLLLVAHPGKTNFGIDAYINRAREKFNGGANRLYVFGTTTESKFFNAVVRGIEGTIKDTELIEIFSTPNDYRGDTDGIGAVFIKKSL
ncbi:MAG: hypothetical protein V4486_03825 [Patescibacteria group bacterium]